VTYTLKVTDRANGGTAIQNVTEINFTALRVKKYWADQSWGLISVNNHGLLRPR
jgi:hypothetical protein